MKERATPHLRARIAFGFAVVILLFVGVISYRGVLLARDSENRVSHTQEVLDGLRALSLAIVTIEASSRGFILTGSETFLGAYTPAVASIGLQEAALRLLLQDNPGQLGRLQALERLTAQKIARTQSVIALRRGTGFSAALAAVETGIGTRITADFHAVIQQMQEVEQRLLVQRNADVERRLWQSKATALLGVALALLIIGAAAWSVRYSGNRRGAAEAGQRESERRFSEMLKHVQLAAVMLDGRARITYCNEHLLRLTGWTAEEIVGRDWLELFIPESRGNRQNAFARLLANLPEAWHGDHEIVTRSGERRLMRWNNSVLRASSGEVIGTASIGEDITDSKVAQDRIVHLNRVYATLGRINALIVRVRDRDELFREACQIAIDAGGFRAAMISVVGPVSSNILPIASAGKDESLLAAIRRLLASDDNAPGTMVAHAIGNMQAMVSNDSKNDERVLIGKQYAEAGVQSIAVLPLIVGGEAKGALALYAAEKDFFHEEEMKLLTELAGDIAFAMDHIGQQERLDYLAYYDVLTGLANRALFLERVTQQIRSASGGYQMAVLLIDLDRFKNINDSLGRVSGDTLLRLMAEWLTGQIGDAVRLARVGGDCFAVVLPEVHRAEAAALLLEGLLENFAEHTFRVGEVEFRIAAKAGMALFPGDGGDADSLFRHAEAALKKAKASGERYLLYTHKMSMLAGQLTMESQLREALERGQFVLHYQPKINLASGKLTSAEALIRWNDPRTGLVPPGRFIPVLEETGLIYEVGRWALRQAVADYLRWHDAGLAAVRIAVNVSPMQLRNRGFVAEIEQVIGADARAPQALELEITESLIMEDVQNNIARLEAIRGLGVPIAIDDFGTGFSSLSYLAKLPVDTLKIDRSFVIEMTTGQQGLALVQTIITLAHSLKLKVVAEGVETEEQKRFLSLLNCDEMQGYLFSKPVPREAFEEKFLVPLVVA